MKTTPDTRPLAERITQGPVASRDKTSQPVHIHNAGNPARAIANVYGNSETIDANAELVIETFNVTHETKRTPRQLADERAELIATLRENMKTVKLYSGDAEPGSIRALQIQQADELLTRLQS